MSIKTFISMKADDVCKTERCNIYTNTALENIVCNGMKEGNIGHQFSPDKSVLTIFHQKRAILASLFA